MHVPEQDRTPDRSKLRGVLSVRSAALWLLVLLQIAVPASYYLWREDPDDERFAWRMFSAVRLKQCLVAAWESDEERGEKLRAVDLKRAVHASWQKLLDRGRRPVIEQFLASRCEPILDPDASAARRAPPARTILERSCVSPAGRPLPGQRFVYHCASNRFVEEAR